MDEDALTRGIITLASEYGRYGYRRITALLRTAGWQVGKDRVQRIWRRETCRGTFARCFAPIRDRIGPRICVASPRDRAFFRTKPSTRAHAGRRSQHHQITIDSLRSHRRQGSRPPRGSLRPPRIRFWNFTIVRGVELRGEQVNANFPDVRQTCVPASRTLRIHAPCAPDSDYDPV